MLDYADRSRGSACTITTITATPQHPHGPAPRGFGAAFAIGIALNAGFVAAEVVFGLAAQPMALLADAVHNAGDVLGLLLAWGAAALARRVPSRAADLWLGARLHPGGAGQCRGAVDRRRRDRAGGGAAAVHPEPVAAGTVCGWRWPASRSTAITAWMFSRGHGDLNIRATFLHMAGDAAVSLGVVVGRAG